MDIPDPMADYTKLSSSNLIFTTKTNSQTLNHLQSSVIRLQITKNSADSSHISPPPSKKFKTHEKVGYVHFIVTSRPKKSFKSTSQQSLCALILSFYVTSNWKSYMKSWWQPKKYIYFFKSPHSHTPAYIHKK